MASAGSALRALPTERGPACVSHSRRPAVRELPAYRCRLTRQRARHRETTRHVSSVGTEEKPSRKARAVAAASAGDGVHLDTSEGTQRVECSPVDAPGVVRAFYDAINRRDLESALRFIGDDCVYEDLIYPHPFTGREAIRQHFERVLAAIPSSLAFSIDDITGDVSSGSSSNTQGPAMTVGLTWHVELNGEAMPFSRGCSFYRCTRSSPEGLLQISYARDIPEPAVKPGNLSLGLLSAATFLLSKLPNLRQFQ